LTATVKYLFDMGNKGATLNFKESPMLNSLKQIERTGQASFDETLRLMSDGFIEVEGGGYYRLTPVGETELARLLLLDRAKKDKRNAAARSRSSALRGAGLKRTADGWA
jgi:DNA-binding PadR family transcriptional regulator